MRTIYIIAAFCLLAAPAAMAKDSFGPWDADVAVGDEAVESPPGAGHGRCCAASEQVTDRGVYDAYTGGAVLLIRVFQIWISPLDGPSCRFRPVCSAYGRDAVRKYGAFLGGVLAGDRILRCNIFSTPGDDPVPDLAPVK
jgi:uncharacterized protein